jgi:hypothetical protein
VGADHFIGWVARLFADVGVCGGVEFPSIRVRRCAPGIGLLGEVKRGRTGPVGVRGRSVPQPVLIRRDQTNKSATIVKIPICAASQQIGRTPGGAKAYAGT